MYTELILRNCIIIYRWEHNKTRQKQHIAKAKKTWSSSPFANWGDHYLILLHPFYLFTVTAPELSVLNGTGLFDSLETCTFPRRYICTSTWKPGKNKRYSESEAHDSRVSNTQKGLSLSMLNKLRFILQTQVHLPDSVACTLNFLDWLKSSKGCFLFDPKPLHLFIWLSSSLHPENS